MSRKRKPLCQIPDNSPSKRLHVAADSCLQSGAIMQMTLRNFMCHSHLEVKFNSNVNFVIGKNGSGKSAILTALIVGLGAKAVATNRGKNLKGFIKAGKTSAQIQIVLNNSGSVQYKRALFGDTITVERILSLSNSGGYKIKDESGAVVTTKAKEVNNIMVNLNIQVDNPVCILTQDMARSFLSNSSSKAMYSLYNKATRLEMLHKEHMDSEMKRREACEIFKEKKKMESDLRTELSELEEKIECHSNIEKMKDDLSDIQAEYLWSGVVSAENDLQQQRALVEKIRTNHDAIVAKFKDNKEHSDTITEKVDEMKRQMADLNTASKGTHDRMKEYKTAANNLACKLAIKRRDVKRITHEIQEKKKEKTDVQYQIDNFTTKMTEVEQKKLSDARELAKLQGDVQKLTAKVDTLQNESFQLMNDIKKMEEESRETLLELESVRSKYNRTIDSISSLKQQTNNPLAVYGRDMAALTEALKRNIGRFSEPPRGPLGSYITVKDKKWRVAVEGFIGSHTLHSFCVNNQNDCDLLFQIINQVWRSGNRPTIITSKFFHKVHDVSNNLVRQVNGCISIYEAITVTDPVVMNSLIDNSAIESILLVPEVEQAIKMMSVAANVPRNCYQAVTVQGDQFYPDPNYKMYSSRYKEARYLQVDVSQVLRQYEDVCKGFENSKDDLQEKFDAFKQKIAESRARSREVVSQLEGCKRIRAAINQKIAEKASSEELDAGNVQYLEMDLKEIDQQIVRKSAELEPLDAHIKELEVKIHEQEEHEEELRGTFEDYNSRLTEIEREFRHLQMKREEIQQNRTYEHNRLQQTKDKLEESTVVLKELQNSVEQLTQRAQEMSERMDKIRTVEVLSEIITKMKKKIDVASLQNGDAATLLAQFEEKQEVLCHTEELLAANKMNLNELTNALAKRKRIYVLTRDYLESYIQSTFAEFLRLRHFQGSVEINYEDHTLDLIVQPQQGSQAITASSNLSGGERSFSTVAFLYSLWQTVNFPFYLLDEFDVFMDKVNRTKVVEMLIVYAKTKKDTQFIFLTPQDISFVHDKDVSLHKLEDPERRAYTQ